MLGFSQVLKPIKWQDLSEEGKNSRNAFRTGAKIQFSEKKYFGVRGTLMSSLASAQWSAKHMVLRSWQVRVTFRYISQQSK